MTRRRLPRHVYTTTKVSVPISPVAIMRLSPTAAPLPQRPYPRLSASSAVAAAQHARLLHFADAIRGVAETAENLSVVLAQKRSLQVKLGWKIGEAQRHA